MTVETKKRARVQSIPEGLSRTKQSMRDECDVNLILKKHAKTGLLQHVNKIQGTYGDFTNVNDYQSSLNAVLDANDRFNGLPSALRKRFNNDPAELIRFVSDDSNYDQAKALGLLSPEKVAARQPSIPPNPTTPT